MPAADATLKAAPPTRADERIEAVQHSPSQSHPQAARTTGHRSPLRILTCPVCQIPMKLRTIGKIEVDECPRCLGVFLDRGELQSLSAGDLSSFEGGSEEAQSLVYTPHGLSSHVPGHDNKPG